MKKCFLMRAALAFAACGVSASAFAQIPVVGGPIPVAQVAGLGPGETVVAPSDAVVAPVAAAPAVFTLTITPQSGNLRAALEDFLTKHGYQLAWSVGDDLPASFNATFSGSVDRILAQVMAATNHMSTPSRVCEHTNYVIRVIPRGGNCQD
jgi:hypothetical protein